MDGFGSTVFIRRDGKMEIERNESTEVRKKIFRKMKEIVRSIVLGVFECLIDDVW